MSHEPRTKGNGFEKRGHDPFGAGMKSSPELVDERRELFEQWLGNPNAFVGYDGSGLAVGDDCPLPTSGENEGRA